MRPIASPFVMGDTSVVPFDSSTSASRSTVFMGNAVIDACDSVKKQLRKMAEANPAARGMPTADLLKAHFGPTRGEVIGIGEAGNAYEPDHPLGGRAAFWELMGAACEVGVDPETCEVTVHKLVLVSDVGKALNPDQVDAQDEGAAVMGLGHTLMEQLILGADGRILNLGSLDYRIPSVKDVPLELDTHIIENADGPGPYGAKGAGEGGTLAVAAAIGAAINQAAGVAIRDLPLTPEKIWRVATKKAERKTNRPRGAKCAWQPRESNFGRACGTPDSGASRETHPAGCTPLSRSDARQSTRWSNRCRCERSGAAA